MHPLRQHPSRKAVERVAEVTGQPVSLSLFSDHFTDSKRRWYSQFQAAREDLLHLSVPEREKQLHLYFFLIIMVAWKFSLTHWTTTEVLHSSF